MKFDKASWLELMQRLDFSSNSQTFEQLCAHYHAKERYYHNAAHISAMLGHFSAHRALADNREAVELAIWFHDAIYQPFSSNNEQDSADWARAFVLENDNTNTALADSVHALIMATLHQAQPVTDDDALLVDIDLSILGTRAEVYAEFEQNVRKEYARVPGFLYKRKRKQVLQGFLDRRSIFCLDVFKQKWEARARENLRRAIEAL